MNTFFRSMLRLALPLAGLTLGCSPALPARLAGTVQTMDEQGIDYSGTSTSAFVLVLTSDGNGRAVQSTRAVSVLETDARQTDETVRFSAHAQWEGETLVLTLAQREPPVDAATPIILRCERWRVGSTVAEPTDATDRTLPGVEWICARSSERPFPLGLVTVQQIPREGEFLLLGETQIVVTEEVIVGQGGRTVLTRGLRDAELPSP